MRKTIGILFTVTLLIACSNSKKQSLESIETKEPEKKLEVLYDSEAILDTLVSPQGIMYKESRTTGSAKPPIVLHFIKAQDHKKFDLGNYYSDVEYITLEAIPDSHKDKISQILQLTDKYILVAGEGMFPAIYCYNREGVFLCKIKHSDTPPSTNKISFAAPKMKESENLQSRINLSKTSSSAENTMSLISLSQGQSLRTISILGDNCLYMTMQEKDAQMHFLNLTTRKVYARRRTNLEKSFILGYDKYINYNYNLFSPSNNKQLLSSHNIKGDSLCSFKSYNPIVKEEKRNATNPESENIYYFNDQLTFRQAYNDTIYRVVSDKQLQPAYIIDLGKQRIDIPTAIYGDKTDKLIPEYWFEAKDFILFVYIENYMSSSKSEQYHFSYYDKHKQKIYIDTTFADYPQWTWVNNSIIGSLPFYLEDMKNYNNLIYTGYTQNYLDRILKDKCFMSFRSDQKEKIKSCFDNMNENEYLVMLLK